MRITIGGDFLPEGPIGEACQRGDAEAVFGDLLDDLRGSDLCVLNLEAPLIDHEAPIAKSGTTMGLTRDHVSILGAAGFGVIGLANNHAMDHDAAGLASTIAACRDAGLTCFGAGPNRALARKVEVCEAAGLRIGFLGMAEHEFGIAKRDSWGVNPLDTLDFVRNVKENSGGWDFLIVLLHGGNEHYPYPRPSLMDTCRFLVEQGADVVVCQHSHCTGCYETHEGGHIVYGQGNLLFDSRRKRDDSWYESVLIHLDVDAPHSSRMHLLPICHSRPTAGVRRMSEPRASAFLAELEQRSEEIVDEDFLQARWDEFCDLHRDFYVRRLGSPNRVFRALDRRTRYSSTQFRTERLNMFRCESHREVIINILDRGLL